MKDDVSRFRAETTQDSFIAHYLCRWTHVDVWLTSPVLTGVPFPPFLLQPPRRLSGTSSVHFCIPFSPHTRIQALSIGS